MAISIRVRTGYPLPLWKCHKNSVSQSCPAAAREAGTRSAAAERVWAGVEPTGRDGQRRIRVRSSKANPGLAARRGLGARLERLSSRPAATASAAFASGPSRRRGAGALPPRLRSPLVLKRVAAAEQLVLPHKRPGLLWRGKNCRESLPRWVDSLDDRAICAREGCPTRFGAVASRGPGRDRSEQVGQDSERCGFRGSSASATRIAATLRASPDVGAPLES